MSKLFNNIWKNIIAIGLGTSVFSVSHAATWQADKDALIALYNSTTGSAWTNKSGWPNGDPCNDSWYGIQCVTFSGTDYVTRIQMPSNNLVGNIPVNLEDMAGLEVLNLRSNQLSGTIPQNLKDAGFLFSLDLSHNQLTGNIPVNSLSASAETFNLSYNDLDGGIPAEFGLLSNLITLNLSYNDLDGNLPSNLGNLSNLQRLDLAGNQLTGSIPVTYGNFFSIQFMNFYNNHLSGYIPAELGQLQNTLVSLILGSNDLAGNIPSELGDLINVYTLDLRNNNLNGSIPSQLGDMASLRNLYLSNNQLDGIIPSNLDSLTNLEDLWLENNQLEGALSLQFSNMPQMHTIYLNSNKINGEVPSDIVTLSNLTNINFDYNGLYTNDTTVHNFLNARIAGSWNENQTIAPANISVLAASDTTITLGWDQVSYLQEGTYQILISESETGPYTQVFETFDKTELMATIGGLTPSQDYYFKLTTTTAPHVDNPDNLVVSESSDWVHDMTDASSLPADLYITGSFSLTDEEHWFVIGNHGPNDVTGARFQHFLDNIEWSCIETTGGAVCPTPQSAIGDIDVTLDLAAGSHLKFNVPWRFLFDSETAVGIVSAPDGIRDTDLSSNRRVLHLVDAIFSNGFD